MVERVSLLRPLQDEQRDASEPGGHIWLSASAGTGKTHVLTARVLRLLLRRVDPSTILCLTFTKAGAAEMADRIHARLASWVRLEDRKLRQELFALGEPHGRPEDLENARKLFAAVLDAAGGGLRIQTIHSFCQTLLAGFPAEAGLSPGFRPIEGREEAALARRVLAELLVASERGGDLRQIEDVRVLSRRLGEAGAEAYLMRCARAPDALAGLGAREGIEARLRRALDVPLGDVEEAIAGACADGAFDCAMLRSIAAANRAWATKTGLAHADICGAFLGAAPARRAEMLEELISVALTAKGEARAYSKKLIEAEPLYAEVCAQLAGECGRLLTMRMSAELAALLAAGLRAGQSFALAYADAKRAAGLVDFDDLIRATVRLLGTPGIGEWVRYKLDQATDHILVDEAQDTNAAQWAIVGALIEEYFARELEPDEPVTRTIFSVGDFKQAIFGFQGTDPIFFEAARRRFSQLAEEARQTIENVSLRRSFRSTQPVLELVDRLLDQVGQDALGLFAPAGRHESARRGLPGTVTLWRPHALALADVEEDEGEEGWVDDATRAFATRLARQIKTWLAEPLFLQGKGRGLRPEDVLILVRRRGDLASLIVARLHAEGVPVAGVDRLRLDAPLAVRDLLSAIRFALQPEDDLTLATLLVSPLFGLSQDDLYRLAYDRGRLPLIARVRADPRYAEAMAGLTAILNAADLTTPYRFLEDILSGPLDGRRRLLRRLGEEARDPIEELLSAALAFEGEDIPSLQRFLDWFDRGEVEIKRDPSAPLDAVRVMTVHGAKGLQAPLVILADATVDPEASRGSTIEWSLDEGLAPVPVFRPRKGELAGSLAGALAAAEKRERAEHWRLLYVALTRAEEHLVIGGALGPRARGVPPAASWYQAIDRAMESLGAEWEDDGLWSAARHYRGREPGSAAAARRPRRALPAPTSPLPAWLHAPAPQEARPPRPLAPSAIGTDIVADPPPSPTTLDAARRGKLLHALFERLPAVAVDERMEAADRWLRHSAGVADESERRSITIDACRIIGDPAFAPLFGPDALGEAPIAAVVGEQVVAGTVDRLLVRPDRVQVVDFKTGRRVPANAEAAPEHHLRQMAAYVAALEVVFPGRVVEAALLYTGGPLLLPLPADLLAPHKPGFSGAEQMHVAGR